MTKSSVFRAWGWWLHALCAIGILVGGPPARAENGCPVVAPRSDGTNSGGPRAPSARFRSERSVYLITASELASGGLLNGTVPAAIGFRYTAAPGVAATGSLKVYLENTSDTSNTKSTLWSTAISTMTLVHDDTTTLPSTIGPFDIPFSGSDTSSFTYTGGGLYVAFDFAWPGPAVSQALIAANLALPGGIKSDVTGGLPTTLAAAATRPETRLTPLGPQAGELADDLSVDYLISLGSVPQSIVSPQSFQAVIANRGYRGETNIPVSLSVTGAQPFSDMQTIASLSRCGATNTVTFAPFTPTVIGSDTITVSIPSDDNAANNTGSRSFDVTDYVYSYEHPGKTPDDFVTAPQNLVAVAKFPITAAAKVSQIRLDFVEAIGTYHTVLYADSGLGTPAATPIYEDAADRSVTAVGPVTVTLPAAVDVGPGTFYAGYRQTSPDGELEGGIDYEEPVRPNTFYALFPGGNWFPFGGGSNNFVPSIGVTFAQCTSAAECDDGNPCTDDACTDFACVHTNNSAPCNDGNACTQTDTCVAGTCVGSNPVTCTASDQCHDAGRCDTITGSCSNPAKTDGTACNDGNLCTQSDTCQAGACVGAIPVTCTALDQCHDAGSCNPTTGACSNPTKTDGTSCNDNNACTQTDTCQAGACVGSNAVTCTASDQCHVAGTCNPSTGVCSNPNAANGTACSDGNACTQTDSCQSGTCVGGNYSWSGFLQPVNADGTSVFKRGSTIPVKFKLTGACGGNNGLVASIYFYKISNSNGPVNEAVSTSAADTGTTFRYSASDDQYIYNLGTSGADITDGTWNLGVDLHDGVGIRSVTVGLRK